MTPNITTFLFITLSQEKVLTALATYKFLTTGQMLTLQIMKDRANLNKMLVQLRNTNRALIGSIAFGIHPEFGKLESVHYLTVYGVALLRQRYGNNHIIKYPKSNTGLFHQDYFHRINTVNVHIAFESWAKANNVKLLFFNTYFDKLSSGKENGYRAESAIQIQGNQYLIADALCMLQTERREELFAIEMYNGNDTNRVHGSLLAHLQGLHNGHPSRQFNLKHGSRVLCIFEKENYKLSAMKRLAEDNRFASAKAYFLFKSLEELSVQNFFNWTLFDGTKVGLF